MQSFDKIVGFALTLSVAESIGAIEDSRIEFSLLRHTVAKRNATPLILTLTIFQRKQLSCVPFNGNSRVVNPHKTKERNLWVGFLAQRLHCVREANRPKYLLVSLLLDFHDYFGGRIKRVF